MSVREVHELSVMIVMCVFGVAFLRCVPAIVDGKNVTIDVRITNVVPDVCCVWEEPDDDEKEGTQVMPNPYPDKKNVTVNACVCDGNGNGDISSVRAEVIYPNGTLKTTLVLSENKSIICTCSCVYGVNCTAFSAMFNMSCRDPPGNYTVNVSVTDGSGETCSETHSFEYLPLIAMSASDVHFGAVTPGGSCIANSSVSTLGNVPLKFVDVHPDGYDDPDIPTNGEIDGIVWSDMNGSSGVISEDNITTSWNPATCIPAASTANVSFMLSVPAGTPVGNYTGTITFTPSACL